MVQAMLMMMMRLTGMRMTTTMVMMSLRRKTLMTTPTAQTLTLSQWPSVYASAAVQARHQMPHAILATA